MELTAAAKRRRAILCSVILSVVIVGFVVYTQANLRGWQIARTPRFWIEKGLIFVGFVAIIMWNLLRDGPYARRNRGD